MTKDTKIVGSVYGILADGVEKYFSRSTRLFRYDALKKYLVDKGNEQYKATDRQFPNAFYEEIANPILDWAWNGFNGLKEEDVTPLLKQVWKLHRKYISMDRLTDEALDKALDEFGELSKQQCASLAFIDNEEYSSRIRAINAAAIRHIEAVYLCECEQGAASTPEQKQDSDKGSAQEAST